MRYTYDASPRASQICGGRYCKSDKRITRRPHGTPDWTLICILRGAGRFESMDPAIPALVTRPGLMVLIPPGTGHTMRAHQGSCDHLWLHFLARAHWMEWMNWPPHPIGLRSRFVPAGTMRKKVVSTFRRAIAHAAGTEPDREAFALHALEELLLYCARIHEKTDLPHDDKPTQACLDHIAANLATPITLNSLAKLSGQSVSRLTQMFRQSTGLSPMQYLEQARLERAMGLLSRTDMQITLIAEQVGFNNPFYFSLRFRKHTGYSPRQFRSKTSEPVTIIRRPHVSLNPSDAGILKRPSSSEA